MSPQALLSALTRLVDDLTEPAPAIIITVQADEGDDIDAMIAERKKDLPPGTPVLTIVTVLGSQPPPPSHAALSPCDAQPGSALPQEPAPEPDPRLLAAVMRAASARQLRAHHVEPDWISLTAPDGEVRYTGSLLEVHRALRRDVVTPLDPVERLRDRLARANTGWTLQDDGGGYYTLCKFDPPVRIFSGPFDEIAVIAERKIFNIVPNRGYAA